MSDRMEISIRLTDSSIVEASHQVKECYEAIPLTYGHIEVRGNLVTIGALMNVLDPRTSFVEDRALGDRELLIIGTRSISRSSTLFD